MATDENILIELFERVTNPSRDTVDNLGIQMFCMIVQSNNALVTKAHELIVKKMHSNNTTEAARAIGLLEECMSKGGSEFQRKTAKFTFLNELIALVLDDHPGTSAPIETKKRIMECLMLWTVEHQDKTKIEEAYNRLKKQVNFAHDCSTANSNSQDLANSRDKRSSILGKDDKLLARLVKQGGVENYEKANLLIRHRFNQEASHTAFIYHLKSELNKIESTLEVLDEMLSSYSSDVPEADSRETIQELYNNCKGHNEQMARWPDFVGESQPEFLKDVLNTKERLMIIIQRYKDIFENEEQYPEPTNSIASATNTDLFLELLDDTLTSSSQVTNAINPNNPIKTNNTMDELNELFGSIIDNVKNNMPQHPSELLGNVLEPISVREIKNAKPVTKEKEDKKRKEILELSEIDKLSNEMLKQNLNKERLLSFKKETKKLTLNEMAKDKIQSSLNASRTSESNVKTHIESTTDYKSLNDLNVEYKDLKENKESKKNSEEKYLKQKNDLEDKNGAGGPSLLTQHLADISIDLDAVTPLDEGQRLLLDDDDIQVTLNFTADRPSEHVSVIVITVTNKSKLPIRDYNFEASVKKPSKVRLLPPTDVVMAPRKPFRPSTPINQVVLLLNPTQKPVAITCIIGYKLGDDPDPIKESIVTNDIPYV